MEKNKIRIIKDFENKASVYYEKNYGDINHGNFIRNLRRRTILENIDFGRKYQNILDCGSGPALLYDNLHEITDNYSALDISPDNLNTISQNHKIQSVKCLLADLDSFEWNGDKFDLIICSGSIEYTKDPLHNIKKLMGYLKSNGELIVSFPNKISPYRIWGRYVYFYIYKLKNFILRKNRFIYKNRLFRRKQILKVLEVKNTVIEKSIYIGLKIIPQPFDNILHRIDYLLMKSNWLNKFDFLNLLKYEFILVLKKVK